MPLAASPAPDGAPQVTGFRRVWRTLKQIFHEVIAGIFAVLAFLWLNNAARAWARDTARWLIAVAVAVAGLFVVFAWSSFRRSRSL